MSRRAGGLATLVALLCAGTLAHASVVQEGNLRITVLSQILPYKLPRHGVAPIAVFVSGHLSAPHGGIPSQLQEMTVQVNKHGLLQSRGLPTCPLPKLQPASTERAMASCGDALIGSGQFWAHIVLPDQGAYPTHGRLLIFNGRQAGKPVIFTHIFTANPFFSSFVIDYRGRQLSYFNAGCPAPEGSKRTVFPLALASFDFADGSELGAKVEKACAVKE